MYISIICIFDYIEAIINEMKHHFPAITLIKGQNEC